MESFDEIKLKDIDEPVILLNIPHSYETILEKTELNVLEKAQEGWTLTKTGKHKNLAKYALAIYHNRVKGVFTILGKWEKIPYDHKRWTFNGEIAPPHIRDKYLNKKIVVAWEQGNGAPFMYLNCNPNSSK